MSITRDEQLEGVYACFRLWRADGRANTEEWETIWHALTATIEPPMGKADRPALLAALSTAKPTKTEETSP